MFKNKTQYSNAEVDSDVVVSRAAGKYEPRRVKIADVLALAMKYWYWVIGCIIICLFFAWFSIQRTNPVYRQSMAVLLRDNVQGNGTGGISIDLGELGLTQTYTILEDEMEALRSPDLMEQVVLSLGLTTQYYTPRSLHEVALYGSSLPVTVSFPDIRPDESAEFKMKVSDSGKIELRDFKIDGKPVSENIGGATVAFGDSINSPVGRFVIDKTPFFMDGESYDIRVIQYPLEEATAQFNAKILIDHADTKKSNVIDIICTDENLQRADDVLSTLMKCYMQNWLKGKAEIVATTNEFINQRLAAVEEELSGVDSRISSFKSDHLIPDIQASSSLFMQESADMSKEIMTLSNQLQMARYLKNYVSTEGKNRVLPVNTGLNNQTVETLITQYNTLVLQRTSLLGNTSESNPIIVEIDSKLAALRTSILASIENSVVSLSNALATLERREQSTNARVAASPQQARVLLSAERKQKVQENLYLYLLQKREENELSQAFININTRILRQPSGSKNPVSPRKAQTYIIAFVLGLFIPVGTIYLIEATNTRVRGRKDLEDMTVPVVGEIPRFKKPGRKVKSYLKRDGKERSKEDAADDLVVEDGNRNVVNEAIRVIRSNLTRMSGDAGSQVIMVTSFNPGSGKTFVTVNLGKSLALKHHRVLLIDGDLRRASLSHFAGSPRLGIADVLSGAVKDVDEVICRDCHAEGLDILPVGMIPPNPTELLETQRFSDLMALLRTKYDYIFIDCPPGEIMADAQIVADVADRTLFVIRVGLFQRALLADVEKLYQEKKYPGMMIVLNDSISGAVKGYSYSYGYGYTNGGNYYNNYK